MKTIDAINAVHGVDIINCTLLILNFNKSDIYSHYVNYNLVANSILTNPFPMALITSYNCFGCDKEKLNFIALLEIALS